MSRITLAMMPIVLLLVTIVAYFPSMHWTANANNDYSQDSAGVDKAERATRPVKEEGMMPPPITTTAANVEIVKDASFNSNSDSYRPKTIEAAPSSAITWINNDSVLHTVTSGKSDLPDSGRLFDSGLILPGAIYQHKFNNAGTFQYWCTVHPFMSGEVIIASTAKLITPKEQEQTLLQLPVQGNQTFEMPSDLNNTKLQGAGTVLKLADQKLAVDIPLQKAYENGNELFYISTDASDNKTAQLLTNKTGFEVNFAPVLTRTPESALGSAYWFKNGIVGNGPLGFQAVVTNAKPGDDSYSPLYKINYVEWKQEEQARELKSINEIMAAKNKGDLVVTDTGIIVDYPAVKWQGGSLTVRPDKIITDKSPFAGGQVTRIDVDKMVVTFVAMRGWGPDGKTLYWIVTDATPLTRDITAGGIVYSPKNEKLATTPVAVDFYQFLNGIEGGGPQGFQPAVSPVNINDVGYGPMWRIYFVYWKDPADARVLETMSDISQAQQQGLIKIMPALGGKHIINCPFFDQETASKHRSSYSG
jgi:plastocyanin